MKCPHCLVSVHGTFETTPLGYYSEGRYSASYMRCPNQDCGKLILRLIRNHYVQTDYDIYDIPDAEESFMVYPNAHGRPAVPMEVDQKFAEDYTEACAVLSFSPKASAALSRRCLQSILREKAGVKPGDLSKEIDEVINSRTLPSYLTSSIDAIRHIGNFAAHPIKSKSTGEVLPVEQGEAEWLLDVLESLFDFYFVQPKTLEAKREALNQKLVEAGKPPMK